MTVTPKVRTLARSGLALLAMVTAPCLSAADPDPAAVLVEFVTTDCEVGDEGLVLARLLQHGTAVQPELMRILREGPDVATSAELRAATEQAWDRRAAFLATNPPLGLTPDDLLRAHGVDREAWIERQIAHAVQHSRERAAIGLAAIGSQDAVRTLREVRGGADHDLRNVIDSALTRFHAEATRTPGREPRPAGGPKKPARP